REVQTMHKAEVNMMVCSKAMVNVARKLQQQYGTPWFEGSFYGVRDTSKSMLTIAEMLGDADLIARTQELIARREAETEAQLAPFRARLKGKRVLLYTGGVKSWSVVAALQDLGMEVVATGTRKSTEEDKARIKELMGDNALMLEDGNARNLLDVAYQYRADLMIAGGRNMFTAYKARLPFLDINQEREHAYAGYEGMVELARQICRSLESPIWAQVKQRAPWQ
ncbi:MAG: nitrogenase component 1, partial [Tolumonas sp.]|nr:nitrogenase component 1 [Tolumonas sp.]